VSDEDRLLALAPDPGSLLRMWRERALLTQEQLAERAGLSVRTVRRFERARGDGRPHNASIRVLAGALELSPAERTELMAAFAATREDPTDDPRTAGPPVEPPPVVPRQLPAVPPLIIGRAREITEIEQTIDPAALPIITVDGMPGVGKTALALVVAHRRVGDYPDGQIYLDLHGYTQGVRPVEPGEALDRVLRSLGVPGDHIPPNVDDRAALYRSRLADRRVLVLLDNASSEAQVTPLVPGTPGCLLLVTSRRRLAALDHTHALSLDLLPLSAAVDVLAGVADVEHPDGEQRERLAEIADLCARLPLALRIAAARLRSRPSWNVEHLAERLRRHDDRLAELEAGERSVKAALDLSVAQLPVDQRQAYALLGMHPGADFDLDAAVALVGAPPPRTGRLLDDLLDAHLLQEPVPGRYRFHDLVREHASTRVGRDGDALVRSEPLHRLLRHYCRTAADAAGNAYPYERPDGESGVCDPADAERAAAWLDTELPNLLTAARYAAVHGAPDCIVALSTSLRRHLWTRGRYADAAVLHELALAAARNVADLAGELAALTALGRVRRLEGRYTAATALFAAAADLARTLGDHDGEADALNGTGNIHLLQSRFQPAADDFGEALRIARRAGRRNKELEALFGLGWVQLAQGRAVPDTFERALEIARAIGHSSGQVRALAGLGRCHRIVRRYEQADEKLTDALRLARSAGERFGELDALTAMGALYRELGRYEPAKARYLEALELARRIGARRYQFETLDGMGRLHQASGAPREALDHHRQALDLATDLDYASAQVRAHFALAATHRALGRNEDARRHWQCGLAILRTLGADTGGAVTTATLHANLAGLAGIVSAGRVPRSPAPPAETAATRNPSLSC
jgi:tetratricopeptide (TPR) repeat protein/transcriptional regulator with XRE-family HTH domain